MNYLKIYESLMEKRKLNPPDNQYIETHHIIPRCIGGSDEKENLIKLTPEEHYFAHLLLVKIYPNVPGLWYAAKMMCSGLEGRNNKLYGWVRRKSNLLHGNSVRDAWAKKYGYEDYISQCHDIWILFHTISTKEINNKTGIPVNNVNQCLTHYSVIYDKKDILKKLRKQKRTVISREVRNNFTEEQELKRIKAVKNITYSAEELKKRSDRIKIYNSQKNNYKYKIVACPHCGKSGGFSAMGRWHFNNCKMKGN